jgi:hypothetical protein
LLLLSLLLRPPGGVLGPMAAAAFFSSTEILPRFLHISCGLGLAACVLRRGRPRSDSDERQAQQAHDEENLVLTFLALSR